MLTPDQYAQAVELFHRARRLSAAQRAEFVEGIRRSDPELRRVVVEMLAQDDEPAVDLDQGLVGVPRVAAPMSTPQLPCEMGQYRLLRIIGQGGMGTVYLAEQQAPARRVALKVIRSDLLTGHTQRRFEFEIEALGRLNHEGIARIHDAGFADLAGQQSPFFAMEYVQGVNLVRHANDADLGRDERLRMFAAVCDAVQHAHQRGVVHRDLKPSNILVTAEGIPKVLDFGVARSIADDALRGADITLTGEVVGTLAYLSPEQLSGDSRRVDTQADVYALGVILFELLTGRLPFEARQVSMSDYLRELPDASPPALSTLDQRLAGDLDTIVGSAMQPDPGARYTSAAALAADVRRFLRCEPIAARAPSVWYQLTKYAQRQRARAAAAVIALAGLVFGVASLGWALHVTEGQRQAAVRAEEEAKSARDLAERRRSETEAALAEVTRQAEVTRAVNEFYTQELLLQAEPTQQADPDLTVRELVRRADGRVADKFSDEPHVRAALLGTLGDVHLGFGEFERARARLEEALTLSREALGERDEYTMGLMQDLAVAYRGLQRHDDALATAREAYVLASGTLGAEAGRTLGIAIDLASIHEARGDYSAAEPIYRETLERAVSHHGPDSVHALNCEFALADAMVRDGRLEEGLSQHRDVLERRRHVHGDDHPFTLASLAALSRVYYQMARYDEVMAVEQEALEVRRSVLGPSHPEIVSSLNTLGMTSLELKQLEGAEEYLREALQAAIEARGTGSAETATLRSNLALVHIEREEYAEATSLLAESLATQRRLAEANGAPPPLIPWFNYAGLFARQGQYDAALMEYEQITAAARETLPVGHYYLGIFLTDHGKCLNILGRRQEAESTLREAVANLTSSLGPGHERTVIAREALDNVVDALPAAAVGSRSD